MQHLSISLTKPQLDYLHAEAKALDITLGELLRRIIDQHRMQQASAGARA